MLQLPSQSVLDTDAFEAVTPHDYYTDTRPIREVRALVLAGGIEVFVRRGQTPSLTVAAQHKEDLQRVTTRLTGDTLHVHGEGMRIGSGNVVITGSNIVVVNGVVISGDQRHGGFQGRVVVGIILPSIASVELSGATTATLLDLRQPALELELSGAGTVSARGVVDLLRARISGAGNVKAKHLDARCADLKVSGAGNIRASVREQVKARVSGAGDVKISGNPVRRDTRVSGVGNIKFN